ncbi:MAG: hypothetical protein KY455_03985 [Euryarchaeota archaeon]|nr:hypothetical protein [Euryarchaeota archaeon]
MRTILGLLVVALVFLPAADAQAPKVIGAPDRPPVEIDVRPAALDAPLVPDVVHKIPVEVAVTCRATNLFPEGLLLRHSAVPLYHDLEVAMTPASTMVMFAPEECAYQEATRIYTIHLEARFNTTAYAFQMVLASIVAEAVDLGIDGRKEALLQVGLSGTVAVEAVEGQVPASGDGCGDIPLRLSTTTNGPVRFVFRTDPDDPPRGILNLVPYRILDAPYDTGENLELQFCLREDLSSDTFALHIAPHAEDDRSHRFDAVIVEVTVVDATGMEVPLAVLPSFTLVVGLAFAVLRRR